MPMAKPKYTLTDTGELSKQLDQAQRRWPEVRDRKELLIRLVAAGSEAIKREGLERHVTVEETAGALTGLYRPDELKEVRADWPE